MCVCSSCDMSSASVQVMEAVDQDLDALDAGKLTEVDKAQTGRVGPSLHQHQSKPKYQLKDRFSQGSSIYMDLQLNNKTAVRINLRTKLKK